MKTAVPKEVVAFTADIRAKRQSIEQHRTDIERAGTAAREAERIAGEIQALSDKRALAKAQAFIEGVEADVAELDRQEAELEKASRRSREDGKAGALAVQLLEGKIARAEADIARLEEDRKAKTLEWLSGLRERAIDKYMAALQALGPIVAEAMAAESARRAVTGGYFRSPDVLADARDVIRSLPIPGRMKLVDLPSGDFRSYSPIEWPDAKPESDHLISELTDAEVLP